MAGAALHIGPLASADKLLLTNPSPHTPIHNITSAALALFGEHGTQAEDRLTFPSSTAQFFADAINPDVPSVNLSLIYNRTRRAFYRSVVIPLSLADPSRQLQLLALQTSFEQSGASDAITAIPTCKLLELGNNGIATAVCMRLSIMSPTVISSDLAGRPCSCNANGQRHGEIVSMEHLLNCPVHSLHNVRHNAKVDTLAFVSSCAGLRVKTNDNSYGNGDKFADMFTSINGKSVAIDVSVRSSILHKGPHLGNLKKAVETALVFADVAEKEKRALYMTMYADEGMDFIPCIIETPLGAFGKGTVSFLNRRMLARFRLAAIMHHLLGK